jgi:hypothetical protein
MVLVRILMSKSGFENVIVIGIPSEQNGNIIIIIIITVLVLI